MSIIVPCYNYGDYLSETLDSVISQTYQNWECVVVNDGSQDNTAEVAADYVQKDARIHYIEQQNSGISITRNTGIKNSHGEYILPLDADDLIAPTYLEKAVAVFLENRNVKVVTCKAELFGVQKGLWHFPEYSFESMLFRNMLITASMFRRSDYDQTKGFDPNMKHGCEDWDFWLSLLSPDSEVYRLGEVLFYYRQKQVSMSTIQSRHQKEINSTIVRNHKEYYTPYLDTLINLRDELYQEKVLREHYYRYSVVRLKDLFRKMFGQLKKS